MCYLQSGLITDVYNEYSQVREEDWSSMSTLIIYFNLTICFKSKISDRRLL